MLVIEVSMFLLRDRNSLVLGSVWILFMDFLRLAVEVEGPAIADIESFLDLIGRRPWPFTLTVLFEAR